MPRVLVTGGALRAATPLPIHEIQGSGAESLLNGTTGVIIEGVVVGDFQGTPYGLGGFFVQEEDHNFDTDPATSEGIFVYDKGVETDVSVGDIVRVQGRVAEYYGLTELTEVTSVLLVGRRCVASAHTVLLPLSDAAQWEQYEGMLITIPQTLVVTGNNTLGRYGEVDLSLEARLYAPTACAAPGAAARELRNLNDRSRIQLDDGARSVYPAQLPSIGSRGPLRVGDTISALTGVLAFSWGSFEIHPTGPLDFIRVNATPSTPPPVGGTLRVANFNLHNYFNGDGAGGGFPTPRGAATAEEFNHQREKIISAISALDADIVALQEVENDAAPGSALENLLEGLNTVTGPGAYCSVDTGIVGNDAIRVAILYRGAAVRPSGPFAILDASVDPRFADTKNRPSLLQTFTQVDTEAALTVVVNHFKSKGSPCDDLGDPDRGDGQGDCPFTRTLGAVALVNYLSTDPTTSGDADFLVLGDFNAYSYEDPLSIITSAHYFNLMEQWAGTDTYTHVFSGESGSLDHAFASRSLMPQVTGAAIWHINADAPPALDYREQNQEGLYTPDPYRSSDHDPLLIGLNLNGVPRFRRGDINADGVVQIYDAMCVLLHLFGDSDYAPSCMDSADVNDDGTCNIADAVYILNYLFAGGRDIPLPFGTCGADSTPDTLGCRAFLSCSPEL